MQTEEKQDELIRVSIHMKVDYRFSGGQHYKRFYREMKENGIIMGVKCPECKQVLVPPRPVCGDCYVQTEEWLPVGPKGTVTAYTAVYLPFVDGSTGKPRPVPYGAGLIQLDGASFSINHILEEGNPEKLYIGMRVEAVFKEQREGNIGDILYFRTIEE